MTKSRRVRISAAVLGLVAIIGSATTVGGPGQAAGAAEVASGPYVALGDSIPLGYSPKLEEPWIPERFVGYPELIARRTQMPTTNFACPGQTAQALVSLTAVDSGCFEARDSARTDGSALLHVDYDGTQLDAARAAVQSDPPPSLVSIQGGGNEVSICLDKRDPDKCLNPVLPKVTKSLRQAVTQLRAAGYRGRVVLVGYHLVPGIRGQLRRMNSAIERAAQQAHVPYADVAVAFDRYAHKHHGDLCKTGLLVKAPDGSCDLHPTRTGHRLYADVVLAAAAAKAG